MSLVLDILFFGLWLVIGFFAARYFARRYLPDPKRANVVAAVAAIALAAIISIVTHVGSPPATTVSSTPPAAAPIPIMSQPAVHLRDVSALCDHLGSFKGDGFGALDDFESRLAGVLSDGAQLPSNDSLTVVGWAGDRSQKRPAQAICLVVDGHITRSAKSFYGGLRPDVVAFKHIDALLPVAYSITINAGRLGSGTHKIRVAARSLDGSAALLPNERTILVK